MKRSSSGICHPPGSPYYERTKSFTAFESIDLCITSGGRLPANLRQENQLAKVEASPTEIGVVSYSRSEFGHGWEDEDGDCQNSRAEALISASSTPVVFAGNDQCRVVRGRWISLFTNSVIQNSVEIDIDHVVPLKWAWEHGADQWTRYKREQFANDPRNLLAVESSLNRSKGAKGPESWLPPSGKCQYLLRFIRILKLYEFKIPAHQMNRYQDQKTDLCQ
ncbi:HNH endonuclease family protein [Marinobacter nauticus]|uniref:HNH endonuclease family protein n=1 Tax=Marinobacter nauticus TaxID=2743 RepID=UPI0040451424